MLFQEDVEVTFILFAHCYYQHKLLSSILMLYCCFNRFHRTEHQKTKNVIHIPLSLLVLSISHYKSFLVLRQPHLPATMVSATGAGGGWMHNEEHTRAQPSYQSVAALLTEWQWLAAGPEAWGGAGGWGRVVEWW